jgi:hypothetical protein
MLLKARYTVQARAASTVSHSMLCSGVIVAERVGKLSHFHVLQY